MFEGRAAIGYDHGHDAEVFYLGLALDERYVEGCLERIGEDDPDEEDFLRGLWEDGDDRGFVLEALKGGGASSVDLGGHLLGGEVLDASFGLGDHLGGAPGLGIRHGTISFLPLSPAGL